MKKSRSKPNLKAVRLARQEDYPAERMIELSAHVQTAGGFNDSFDIIEGALGETVEQGSLFAYLFRRFGYPNKGSDPHKELAGYLLTTTRPDMLLRIVPYAGGNTSISFKFSVSHEVRHACDDWMSRDRNAHAAAFLDWIESEGRVPDWADDLAEQVGKGGWPIPEGAVGWRRMMHAMGIIAHLGIKDHDPADKAEAIRWYQSVKTDYDTLHPVPPIQWRLPDVAAWDADDPMKPYAEAMAETLRDLQRPVWIRDVPIGIHGRIEEDEPEGAGNLGPEADAAACAGFPSGDLGNHDPEGFAILHAAILRLDPDPSKAIARAVALLSEPESESESLADDA